MSDTKKRNDLREIPKPADISAALAEVVSKLEAAQGEIALIGGVALAIFGIERYTKDVDFAVTVGQCGRALDLFRDADPRPLRIGGVSVLTALGTRVDLIDRRFEYRRLFEAAIAAAVATGPRIRAGDKDVPVVPMSYLLALKMAADRAQDEADVQALLAKPELDYREARKIVHEHIGYFAARRLDRLARAVGRRDAPTDYENGDPYAHA